MLAALSAEIQAVKDEQDEFSKQLSAERRKLQATSAERDQLARERAMMEQKISETAEAVAAVQKEFSDYKITYRKSIQSRAKGIELDDIKAGDAYYRDVVVSSATDAELAILHSGGMTRVALASVPKRVQDLFGFDEQAALSAAQAAKQQREDDELARAIAMANKSTADYEKKQAADEAREAAEQAAKIAAASKPRVTYTAPVRRIVARVNGGGRSSGGGG